LRTATEEMGSVFVSDVGIFWWTFLSRILYWIQDYCIFLLW